MCCAPAAPPCRPPLPRPLAARRFGILGAATDVAGVASAVAAIFMTAAFCGILQMDSSLPVLIAARPIFYRETAAYMYDPIVRAAALLTVELPWLAAILLWVMPIGYFMQGLVGSAWVAPVAGTTSSRQLNQSLRQGRQAHSSMASARMIPRTRRTRREHTPLS